MRFKNLTELSADAYWEQDRDHRFVSLSGAPFRDYGFADIIGKARWELPFAGMDEAAWEKHRAQLDARETFRDLELACVVADAELHYFSVNGQPFFDEQGNFQGYRGTTRDITRRKRDEIARDRQRDATEAALRDSEARFRSLTALSSDWYWEQDENLRFTAHSTGVGLEPPLRRAEDPLRRAEDLSKQRWELPILGVGDAQWAEHKATLAARKPFADFEYQRMRADGSIRSVSVSGEPKFDAAGNFAGYRGIGKDVTERRRVEQSVGLEHAVTRCLSVADTASSGLQEVIRVVCETLNWDCGRYFRLDESSGELRFAEFWGIPSEAAAHVRTASHGLNFAPGNGLVGRAWRFESPLWMADMTQDAGTPQMPIAVQAGMHGAFVFPVMAKSKPIGVLAFSSREIREPDRWLLQAVPAIGSQLGQFLQRQPGEEQLRESEARYRALTALSSDWFWEHDENQRFTRMSDHVLEKSGISANAILGKTRWETGIRYEAADRAALEADIEARRTFQDFEFRRVDAGGVERVVHISGMPMWDASGRYVGYRGIGRDITERKRREVELRRFRAAMDATADAIYLIDPVNMRFIDVNATACQMLGYTREELLEFGPASVLDSAPGELEMAYAALMRNDSGIVIVQASHRRKDGSYVPVEIQRRALQLAEGWIIVIVVRDISNRIRAAEQLKESEEKYRLLWETTTDAIVLMGADNRIVYANPAVKDVFGYAPDDLEGRDFGILQPERLRLAHRHGVKRYLETGAKKLDWRAIEVPGLHRDGHEFPVEVAFSQITMSGKPIFAGLMRDISERKKAEGAMRHHAVQQGLIAKFGQQALASTDLDELINQAARVIDEGLDAGFCAILQLAPDGHSLVVKSGSGWSEGWIGRHLTDTGADSQNAFVLESRDPVTFNELLQEARFTPSAMLTAHRIVSGIDLRIAGASGPYGLLGAYSREGATFTAASVDFLQSIANVLTTAIDRKIADQKVAYLAQFDSLTGLPNRNLFRDRLAQTLTQAERNGWQVGVVFLDLDDFKNVNDTCGHAAGDKLLTLVAHRLQQSVRSGDTVGRLGGDEFGIVFSNIAEAADANLVAQQVIAALERSFLLDGDEIRISASLGIALYPEDGKGPEVLLKNADTAMYRAKEQGRNNFQFYTQELNARATRRMGLERELRRAIERSEFELYYQPQVSLDTGRIIGVEALIRWRHPERGLLLPAEFIGVAEETRLILPIGQWVIEAACAQAAEWHRTSGTKLFVSVNVSPAEIRRGSVVTNIRETLAHTGLDPRYLEIEVTETLLMDGAEPFIHTLQGLKKLGVTIAIDDFGTGYSSLSYLKRFPIDKVKIDCSFIRDIVSDPDDAAIVKAVVAMSHHLKLKVVAEGVETTQQAEFLRRTHCDVVQGFLFGAPVSATQLELMLATSSNQQLLPDPSGTLRSLLIVDDEENNLRALKRALRGQGYNIQTATSALEGLELLA
ncbi:MAG: PAS domain S-box protein, partial [Betaproteobacteria bacterium]|nr:PAS domain S-box protein [Betaproteobacteria bacterium]